MLTEETVGVGCEALGVQEVEKVGKEYEAKVSWGCTMAFWLVGVAGVEGEGEGVAGNFNNLANIEQLFHLGTVKGLLGCRDKCGLFLDLEELTKEMRGTNKLYLGGGVISVSRWFSSQA